MMTPQQEFEREYGLTTLEAPGVSTADTDQQMFEQEYGLKSSKKKAPEPPKQETSFIGDVIKKSLANTPEGLLAQATGLIDPYPDKDLGTPGNIAAGIGSFVASPTTYLTGGLGTALAKGAALKFGAGKIVQGAIAAGTQFGAIEGGKELIRTGDPMEALKAGGQGALSGAMFGPAGAIENKLLRTAAEVGTMAATGPITEQRGFTKDDWIHAAGTVGGFKLAGAIGRAVKGLRPGEDPKPAIEAEIGPKEAARVEAAILPKAPIEPLASGESVTPDWAARFATAYPERAAQIASMDGPFTGKYVAKKMSGPSWEAERSLQREGRDKLKEFLKGTEEPLKTGEAEIQPTPSGPKPPMEVFPAKRVPTEEETNAAPPGQAAAPNGQVVAAPTAEASAAPKPWEMTRKEYSNVLTSQKVLDDIILHTAGEPRVGPLRDKVKGEADYYREQTVQIKDIDTDGLKELDPRGVEAERVGKSDRPIVITSEGEIIDGRHRVTYAMRRGETSIKALVPVKETTSHKKLVERAISEGKIASHPDYPDLAAKVKPQGEVNAVLSTQRIRPITAGPVDAIVERFFSKHPPETLDKLDWNKVEIAVRELSEDVMTNRGAVEGPTIELGRDIEKQAIDRVLQQVFGKSSKELRAQDLASLSELKVGDLVRVDNSSEYVPILRIEPEFPGFPGLKEFPYVIKVPGAFQNKAGNKEGHYRRQSIVKQGSNQNKFGKELPAEASAAQQDETTSEQGAQQVEQAAERPIKTTAEVEAVKTRTKKKQVAIIDTALKRIAKEGERHQLESRRRTLTEELAASIRGDKDFQKMGVKPRKQSVVEKELQENAEHIKRVGSELDAAEFNFPEKPLGKKPKMEELVSALGGDVEALRAKSQMPVDAEARPVPVEQGEAMQIKGAWHDRFNKKPSDSEIDRGRINLQQFVREIKEFYIDPVFEVVIDRKNKKVVGVDKKGNYTYEEKFVLLRWYDGGIYTLVPENFGIHLFGDFVDGQRIRVPVEVIKGLKKGSVLRVDAPDATGRLGLAPKSGEPEMVTPQETAEEPTRLGKAAQEHKAKAAEIFAELEKRGQKLGSTGGGIDPKSIGLWLKATSHEIRAAGLSFADYVAKVVSKFGHDLTTGFKNQIREAWESHRTKEPGLEPAGDIDAILAGIEPGSVQAARPDLANPGETTPQREFVNSVDALRNAIEEPQAIPQAEMRAKAEERFRADPEGERAKLRDPNWVPTGQGADTAAAAIVFNDAVDRWVGGDQAAISDAVLFGYNYRAGRGNTARELAMGWDRTMGPGERMALGAREALFQPPEKIEKQIKAAQVREAREQVEAPVEPAPNKPEGRRKKTAEEIAADWALEVEKLRAKLAGMGYNVDAALRGELDPIAQKEFVREVHALKATTPDKIYEWWSNAILSGPATQVTNAIGNVAHAGWHFTAERITDAFLNSVARGIGIKSDGARFGEFKHIYRAFVDNWGKSAKNFYETWHSEVPTFYRNRGMETETAYGYRPGAIAGAKGKAIRTPWRLLAAVDDFVKTQVYEMERSALAYRKAAGEGFKGEKLAGRMRELLDDPGSSVNQHATDSAIRLAFQESTKFGKGTSSLVHSIPGARYVLPFITTPFNIVKAGVRKSPFGSIKLASEVLKASQSGDWSHISPRIAEQVLAWGATLALAYGNDPANPWLTGGDDPNRKYSIKIGGQWYSYSRVEPFATTLGLLVDGINKIHEGKDLFEALKAPFDALLGRVDDQTFFAGISDFMKAARYQDSSYVLEWASKFPSSWVPNLVRAPLRNATDEVPQRRIWGKGAERADRILDRGLKSFEVMPDVPRYDLWGRPTPKDGSPIPHTDWIWRTLSPVGEKRYVETIGDRLLARWNAAHPDDRVDFKSPNPYFAENGKQSYFTDAEYAQYVRESGRLTQERVTAMQARGSLNMNDPGERDIERLKKVVETSRDRVRNAIKRARRKATQNAA